MNIHHATSGDLNIIDSYFNNSNIHIIEVKFNFIKYGRGLRVSVQQLLFELTQWS